MEKAAVGLRRTTAPGDLTDYEWIKRRLAGFDKEKFIPIVPGEDTQVIVWLYEKEPVAGIISYQRLGWRHIDSLWVDQDQRGNGFATALFEEIEMLARRERQLGLRILTTTAHLALELYLRLGCRIDARWPITGTMEANIEEVALSKTFN